MAVAIEGNFLIKSDPRFSSFVSFRIGLIPTKAESTN
jgi:hypothetical protein